MRMFSKTILVTLFFTVCSSLSAQTNVDYSLYTYSLNLVNPSFAGIKPKTELLIDSKMQWVGVKDAPRTSSLSLNMPVKENLGFGVTVLSDKVFGFSQTQIGLDVSYKIKLDEKNDFHFGIKAMGNIYAGEINKLKVNDSGDEFFEEAINEFSPNCTIGGAIVNEKYYAHLAIKNLLSNKRYKELETTKNLNRFNFLFGGGYVYPINENVNFRPSTLVRVIEGTPMEFDINTTFEFKEKYNIGMSYFWNNSLQINALAEFSDWLGLGYGYRLYTNDIGSKQSGTHELILKINMDKIF